MISYPLFLLQYVTEAAEIIKKTAHWEVDVDIDLFHAKSGANNLVGGLFKGKTLVYSDLSHIVLRIMPKYASEAGEKAILVSSHIDTVFAAYVCNMLWIYIMSEINCFWIFCSGVSRILFFSFSNQHPFIWKFTQLGKKLKENSNIFSSYVEQIFRA